MQRFQSVFFLLLVAFAGFLSACSSESPPEKSIIGTWVQNTPYSITDRGLQTTTFDTVLKFKKNGQTHLSRKLDIIGQGLPEAGILVSVELQGHWELTEGHLRQTPDTVLIMPRSTDEASRQWAEKLQSQAEESDPSVKAIISADKDQLILQDFETGTTDVYTRK